MVTGIDHESREVLVTKVLDGDPDHTHLQPGPTIWPFVLAVGTAITFVGAIFTPRAVIPGGLVSFLALVGWFWPKWEERVEHEKLPATLR